MNIFKEYQSADALSMSLRAEEQLIDAFGTCYLNGNKIDDFFDYNNIIKESLKQYNTKQVQDKLKQYFPFIKFDTHITNSKYNKYFFAIILDNKDDWNELFKTDKFESILHFYNFFISERVENNLFMTIEPIVSDNVNDIVYKHNKGILYHFTFDDEITNRILKTGLRVKKAEYASHIEAQAEAYRNFPKRIYLYRTKNVYGNLLDDVDDIIKFLFEMFKTTPKVLYNISKMQIIKVDLNRLVGIKHELNFFKDTSMKSNQTIFTYNNIHKDALHLLNNKFLEKLKDKLITQIKD